MYLYVKSILGGYQAFRVKSTREHQWKSSNSLRRKPSVIHRGFRMAVGDKRIKSWYIHRVNFKSRASCYCISLSVSWFRNIYKKMVLLYISYFFASYNYQIATLPLMHRDIPKRHPICQRSYPIPYIYKCTLTTYQPAHPTS
jgi:hypothetical protein